MGKIAQCDHFRMADWLTLPSSVGAAPFIVEEAGTTTATAVALANDFNLALSATDEVQNLMLSMGDVLRYDIDNLLRVEFIVTVTTASAVGLTIAWGVGAAKNVDEDAITAAALFKCEGSLAVLCETDDGSNEQDDVATGETLVTAVTRRCAIDFARDVQTVAPPGTSKAGKGNIYFYMDDSNGMLRRVCSTTLFDMSSYASGLQIYAMIGKASGATLGTLGIRDIKVEHKLLS